MSESISAENRRYNELRELINGLSTVQLAGLFKGIDYAAIEKLELAIDSASQARRDNESRKVKIQIATLEQRLAELKG